MGLPVNLNVQWETAYDKYEEKQKKSSCFLPEIPESVDQTLNCDPSNERELTMDKNLVRQYTNLLQLTCTIKSNQIEHIESDIWPSAQINNV